ncbi:MAG: MCE family protein [Silicimonas sp.]|nr:MCE family protein [Silicimonas sp.]
MNDDIPGVDIQPGRRSFFERASIVWLVPVAALLIAVGIALTTWRDQGPVIEIAFTEAGGILTNETQLKYRNVAVGVVEGIRFSENLERVIVSVRLDKSVAAFVDGDAAFWVVRPEVSASGVSGLETVLSGVYIEGSWDNMADGTQFRFDGLDEAPLVTSGRRGLEIELRSSRDSGMTENTPIVYKGIEVGRIGNARISQDGRWVFANAIIFEPQDQLVTTATRFWDTSGFSFSLGPNGAELDFSSVASLIAGGITFDTLVSGGQTVRPGTVFEVFPDQAAARTSIFEQSDGNEITLTAIFEDNVSGLAAGAPVEWRGVNIGEVLNVTGLIDADRFGDARVRLMATIEIRPARFGLVGDQSEEDVLQYLAQQIDEGLRARLASASILTGGLKIEMVTDPEAQPAELDLSGDPFPVFPVTASEIADVSATAEGVFQRINALPVEELLESTIAFLDNATAFVTSEDFRETPGELRGLLSDARGLVGSDEVQALPGELSAAMADIRSATSDLREIVATLAEADAANRLVAAVDQVASAGKAAEEALAGIPDLTTRIDALVVKATDLPLEDLTAEATGLARDARGFIGSEAAQALPASVSEAVASLGAVLDDLTEAGTAEQLNAALASAREAAAAVELAVQDVPQVVERIDRIVANAEDVKLDVLATELGEVLASADALFGDAGEADLPAALAGAFREMDQALAELRAGGLIDSANETLASTRQAASAVADAAEDLPGLVQRIDRALTQAQGTLSTYDDSSTFSREVAAALRDIQRAAKSVDSLARTLERRPNSIILGR